MDSPPKRISDRLFTIEEWLALEAKTDKKYEWHNGELWDWHAMAGGTPRHMRITGDTYSALDRKLSAVDNGCLPNNSDLAIHVNSEGRYYYPDGSIICGELELSKEQKNAATNPILLYEVVSKTSELRDRTLKPRVYRRIPSLVYYMIIAQEEPWVVLHIFGDAPNSYSTKDFTSVEDEIHLPELDIIIPMKDIYGRVTFAPNEQDNDIAPEI